MFLEILTTDDEEDSRAPFQVLETTDEEQDEVAGVGDGDSSRDSESESHEGVSLEELSSGDSERDADSRAPWLHELGYWGRPLAKGRGEGAITRPGGRNKDRSGGARHRKRADSASLVNTSDEAPEAKRRVVPRRPQRPPNLLRPAGPAARRPSVGLSHTVRDEEARVKLPTASNRGQRGNVSSKDKNADLVDDRLFMPVFRQLEECKACVRDVGGVMIMMHGVLEMREHYAATCPTDKLKKTFLMTHMRGSRHIVPPPGPDGYAKMWRWPDGIQVQGVPTADKQYHWCVRCFCIIFQVRVSINMYSSSEARLDCKTPVKQ
jgi:hypothetical protein